ncbi:MAG: hypothetical protein H7Y01_10765 [Ferruginibacter sp.]|nr:hypothetical protein [Chitinophagaceae bacterium]
MKLVATLLSAVIICSTISLSAQTNNVQTCMLSCPSNMVVKSDAGMEGALLSFPASASLGIGDCGTITYSRPNGSFFRIGSHSVIATTSFGQKCFFTVTVTDNEPPVLSELTLSSKRLSPTNKMKKVAVYYSASDNAQVVTSVLSVSSNDPDANNRDWQVVNNHLVRLKTTPLASGEARVYTITVNSRDGAGNMTKRSTSIASKSLASIFGTEDATVTVQPVHQ